MTYKSEEEIIKETDNRLYEMMMRLFVKPPGPGERILVTGLEHLEARVFKMEWIPEENRYKLYLSWGKKFGNSHVFGSDEGTVWRRFLDVN